MPYLVRTDSSELAYLSGKQRNMAIPKSIVPVERVAKTILQMRDQKVILDADSARLYGVTTKRLNE